MAVVSAMPSQFGDKDSWQGRTRPDVPKSDAERPAYLLNLAKQRTAAVADQYRDSSWRCTARSAAARSIRRGVSARQYGRQATIEEFEGCSVGYESGSRAACTRFSGFTGSQVPAFHGFVRLHPVHRFTARAAPTSG